MITTTVAPMIQGIKFICGFWLLVALFLASVMFLSGWAPTPEGWTSAGVGVVLGLIGLKIALRMTRT